MLMLLHRAKTFNTTIFLYVAVISDPVLAIQTSVKASYLTERPVADNTLLCREATYELSRTYSSTLRTSVLAANETELPRTDEAFDTQVQPAQYDEQDLIRALRGDKPQMRRNAARALGRLGQVAQHAMPALLLASGDRHWDVRAEAVWAIGKVARQNEAVDAVSVLTTALDDPSDRVRWSAAWSLARIGPAAEAAVPALIERLKDPSQKIRASAVSALTRVASQSSHDAILPALVRLKDDDNNLVRERVAKALRALKSSADASFEP